MEQEIKQRQEAVDAQNKKLEPKQVAKTGSTEKPKRRSWKPGEVNKWGEVKTKDGKWKFLGKKHVGKTYDLDKMSIEDIKAGKGN